MSTPSGSSVQTTPPRATTADELSTLPLFEHLDADELGWLADRFEALELDAQRLIVREGDPATAFYLILDGAAAVFRDAVGIPVQLLERLHRGQHVGDLALFGAGAFAASVRTTEPTTVLRIPVSALKRFLERHPGIERQLQASAARRHTQNVASMLELGRRREVRIRCGQEMRLRTDGAEPLVVRLENLSLGGLCLSGAPEGWVPPCRVAFGLWVSEGVLELEGDVVWRAGDSVGVRFVKKASNHDMIVQMAIRLIVESTA